MSTGERKEQIQNKRETDDIEERRERTLADTRTLAQTAAKSGCLDPGRLAICKLSTTAGTAQFVQKQTRNQQKPV